MTSQAGLGSEISREWRRVWTRPYDELSVVLINAALMCSLWFFLPTTLRDWVFSLHGPLAFPVVLAMWMLADVPATNLLGADVERAVALLDDPVGLRRWLWAKTIVLVVLVSPVCAVLAVVVGIVTGHTNVGAIAAVCAAILLVPVGVVAVSSWLGILYPYHQRSLRWRWEHRRSRGTLRWLVLIVAPYVVVPAIAVVLLVPAIAVSALASGGRDSSGHVTADGFIIGALVGCAVAAVVFVAAHRYGAALVTRRRDALAAHLGDPDRG